MKKLIFALLLSTAGCAQDDQIVACANTCHILGFVGYMATKPYFTNDQAFCTCSNEKYFVIFDARGKNIQERK